MPPKAVLVPLGADDVCPTSFETLTGEIVAAAVAVRTAGTPAHVPHHRVHTTQDDLCRWCPSPIRVHRSDRAVGVPGLWLIPAC